ncbi:anthocyanidin 3-O-glucosyltransferase 5-like [Camellia sinensis]|uniref:Glycosyltransferase n=1 Tax=Camellia sinensis var. sinensis TaxID=542762 RepID=A0A4S4E1W7_CAMSN|nr:anthocyanidin 3-O-glucosyltransferase 5-like [Camellia sinensis]THG09829.1 hypothetical protein TEA_005456 [Camellia sinensis var. sinensis]
MESRKLHAAILSSPGMGHLVPVLELGKHLATNHGLEVTILVVATHSSPAESQLLDPSTAPKHLHILRLPPVDISSVVNPDIKVVSQLAIIMREARPAIRSVLSSMKQRPAMFIVDLFGNEAFGIADEFHMSKYLFVTSTAWFTALTLYCHVLDKEVEGQYADHKEPLRLPGCKPVRPEDVVDPMLDRNCQQYYEYLRVGFEYSMCDGILINTWEDLERISIKALQADETLRSVVKVPVYPVGPLTKPLEPAGPKSELLEWLDKQPSESVIYVSFGSGGTLSAEQTTELAWGLELSRQRFVWVLRPPKEDHADASFFTSGSGPDGTPEFLPDGFLTRTHKAGVVVPLWGPQLEILSHPSVGGFLSHCGWNSTLESLSNGVPMIAWPLYAEQRLNATMLAEELGVAVKSKVLPTKKVVRREEIEEMVRTVMESKHGRKEMRERAKELQKSGKNALSKGGSSYKSICDVIKECELRLRSHKI